MLRNHRPSSVERLVTLKSDFIAFVRARVGSEAEAEDLLQAAYVKAAEKAAQIRDDESTVAWFYRLLRNAIVDHRREWGCTRVEPLDAAPDVPDPELRRTVCACVNELVPMLKPEWGRLVRRVDLEAESVPEAARVEGITANNAAVRLHRARAALRDKLRVVCGACARHGCLDCGCHHRSP